VRDSFFFSRAGKVEKQIFFGLCGDKIFNMGGQSARASVMSAESLESRPFSAFQKNVPSRVDPLSETYDFGLDSVLLKNHVYQLGW